MPLRDLNKFMWNLIKKTFYVFFLLIVVALIFDFKIMDQGARTWAWDFWNQPYVQSIYHSVVDRTQAVFNKEINLEDAFKPNPSSESSETQSSDNITVDP